EVSGDGGCMRGGCVALEGVDEAIAFDAVPAGSGRGGGGFAGAGYRERFWNVEAEGGGVAGGGIVREWEPARGEKQEGAIASDGGGADAGDGTVFFIGERAGVGKGESYFSARRH